MFFSPASDVPTLPVSLMSQEFQDKKGHFFEWMLEQAPICRSNLVVMKPYLVARYEDCLTVLKDPRFVRNRSTATGGRRFPLPIPVPRSVRLLTNSLITDDKPNHTRLRNLVAKAFTPTMVAKIGPRIEALTDELLKPLEKGQTLDIIEHYCLPIPVTVIREMLGITEQEMPRFTHSLRALTDGLNGFRLFWTLFVDLPRGTRFVSEIIARKRAQPEDDILTQLIQAEEQGDRLSPDELISLTYLLIIAGFETTVHLISNSLLLLMQNRESLERLLNDWSLLDNCVEEALRLVGPVQGTKPHYNLEEVSLRGVTLPRASTVIPVLGAANRDPRVFDQPHVFQMERENAGKHLGFGFGPHYCLGATLARMEARIAIKALFERFPKTELAIPESELKLQRLPLWHRYRRLPVRLQ